MSKEILLETSVVLGHVLEERASNERVESLLGGMRSSGIAWKVSSLVDGQAFAAIRALRDSLKTTVKKLVDLIIVEHRKLNIGEEDFVQGDTELIRKFFLDKLNGVTDPEAIMTKKVETFIGLGLAEAKKKGGSGVKKNFRWLLNEVQLMSDNLSSGLDLMMLIVVGEGGVASELPRLKAGLGAMTERDLLTLSEIESYGKKQWAKCFVACLDSTNFIKNRDQIELVTDVA